MGQEMMSNGSSSVSDASLVASPVGDQPAGQVHLLRLLVEHAFSAVAVIDPQTGRFLFSSDRVLELLGMTRRQMMDSTWQQITGTDDVSLVDDRAQRLLKGELQRYSYQKRVRRGDGVWSNLGLVISRAEPESGVVFVVQLEDLTRNGYVSALIRLVASRPEGRSLARALALGVLAELDVHSISLYRVDFERQNFVSVGSHGVAEHLLSGYETLPTDVPLPIGEVYRTGTMYNASIRTMTREFPASAGWVEQNEFPDTVEVTILPVFDLGSLNGVIIISTHAPMRWTVQVRNTLETISACFACWLAMESTNPLRPTMQQGRGYLRISERQRRTLQLVAVGHTNAQIAARLGFSEGTVRSDLLRLTRIFRVHGRINLVDAARRSGMLDPFVGGTENSTD